MPLFLVWIMVVLPAKTLWGCTVGSDHRPMVLTDLRDALQFLCSR